MRKVYFKLAILLFLASCEDVVEIDTPTESPRLFVDGVIRIDESSSSTNVSFQVGLTNNFFDDTQTANLDEIRITNDSYIPENPSEDNFLDLVQSPSGRYEGSKDTNFFTNGGELVLSISFQGENFRAVTNYVPAVPIDNLIQGEGSLFSGDETEIVISFTDNGNRDDYYLFDFDFNEYLVSEDEFYQGQTFEFSYFYDDDVEAGREVDISLLGVDETFFNYMNQVIVQAGGDQGPFQTPSATVRGNILNISDNSDPRENFALGYFAVCQTYSQSITIE
ncbi:DUF4249 family protein [Euzebyella saccharophila]|uniref:DUF4249 family protein n=1 Tax=Euzebyella saccharophila TaxID=679664 RepID=A0ABV8JRQ5_9FLAO|nr:DUF4249 family protein [Euzebyella saccharophila]